MERISLIHTDFADHTSGVVYRAAGLVYSVSARNKNGAVRYLQLFNKATAPVAGDIPTVIIEIPANGITVLGDAFFSRNGLAFNVGVAWGFSTTEETFTAGTAADQVTQIVWSRF